MTGSKLGDYELVRPIGKGGMGTVYAAVNPQIQRRVAIKLLLPEYAKHTDAVRRFLNEARAVNTINHPGVVQISDVGKAPDGSLFLVMELLEGQTLSERLTASQGKLPEDEIVSIIWQLAGALSAAHVKQIVHRDLKPGNIMLVPDMAIPGGDRVKLLDFGIAKLSTEHLHGDEQTTRTGQIIGTAGYMSPEQFDGDKTVDGQSDVYSLGVVMYRMIAGRLPFISKSNEMALAAMHMHKPPPPLQEIAPEMASWLRDLTEQMLAKTPSERPTMEQVLTRVQTHLPFRIPVRVSQVALSVDNTSGQRLKSFEARLGLDSSSSLDAVAATEDHAPSSPESGRPGTITRATGQSKVAVLPWYKQLRWMYLGSLPVIALGILSVIGWRIGRPPEPASPDKKSVVAPAAAPPAAPPTAPPSPLPAAAPSDRPSGAASRDKGDGNERPTKKLDGKKDAKQRSRRKVKETPILD